MVKSIIQTASQPARKLAGSSLAGDSLQTPCWQIWDKDIGRDKSRQVLSALSASFIYTLEGQPGSLQPVSLAAG